MEEYPIVNYRGDMEGPPIRESVNGLFRNKVKVIQAVKGYRVSEDALIVSWFAGIKAGDVVLDAGTGCGVIAFGLALKEPAAFVVGVEIQQSLADRAQRGVRLNNLQARVAVVRSDMRSADQCFRPGSFDAVVSNPPYYEPGRGRISSLPEKALARHQFLMPPEELFRTSRVLLGNEGRLSLIYPADRVEQILDTLKETGFTPSRMLWIHPQQGSPPLLACIEAELFDSGETSIEPPLILYDESGARTDRAEAVMAGEPNPENRGVAVG